MEGIGDGERERRRRGWPRDARVLAGKPDTAGRSVSLFPRRVKGAGFYWGVRRGAAACSAVVGVFLTT